MRMAIESGARIRVRLRFLGVYLFTTFELLYCYLYWNWNQMKTKNKYMTKREKHTKLKIHRMQDWNKICVSVQATVKISFGGELENPDPQTHCPVLTVFKVQICGSGFCLWCWPPAPNLEETSVSEAGPRPSCPGVAETVLSLSPSPDTSPAWEVAGFAQLLLAKLWPLPSYLHHCALSFGEKPLHTG